MSYHYNMKNIPRHVIDSKNYMKSKEFWIVDYSQNNFKELQDVLDVYYNELENCYMAEVFHSQNSSRLTVKCNVCNAGLGSYDPLLSHNNGKNHKSLVCKALSQKDGPPIVRFKPLEELENPFDRGTFESDLFETKYEVVGFQFLYREIFGKTERFTCQLCDSRNMKQKKAFHHITSESHIKRYMKVKYNINSEDSSTSRSKFQQHIEDVIIKEGKIISEIYTIKYMDEKDFKRNCSWAMERSVSPKDGSDSGVSTSRSLSQERQMTPDPKMDKFEDFITVTMDHLDHIKKNEGDNITAELQKDLEAIDLLIGTSQVLSQKIYLYSLKDGNHGYEEDAKSLLKKAELLKPVMADNQKM